MEFRLQYLHKKIHRRDCARIQIVVRIENGFSLFHRNALKRSLEHRLVLRAAIGKLLAERTDKSQTGCAPEILDADNVEQNEPSFLVPYPSSQIHMNVDLAGTDGAI